MKSLRWILQFVFGCRHRHLSRVFTIKHRTYRVCFDCATEFELPDAHGPARSDAPRSAHEESSPCTMKHARFDPANITN